MESFENNEEISRESVVEALRSTPEDMSPETLGLLNAYKAQLDARAENIGTNRANLECELEMAKIYFEGNVPRHLVRESFEEIKLSIQNDYGTDHSDLLSEIDSYLDRLGE